MIQSDTDNPKNKRKKNETDVLVVPGWFHFSKKKKLFCFSLSLYLLLFFIKLMST